MDKFADRFFSDAQKVTALKDVETHRSYRAFVNFFAAKSVIAETDVVIGAYFTYGWMPKMLRLRGDLAQVVTIANRVKRRELITEDEVRVVAQAINGSIVGASKFLHFIGPEQHAIWDSRVYRYIHQQSPHGYRLNEPGSYSDYLWRLDTLSKDVRFAALKERMEQMITYRVSAKRIGEMVMFYNGAKVRPK